MKYRFDQYHPLSVSNDAGPWFDTEMEALNAEIARVELEMQPWFAEASEALRLREPYRGGGVLKLAELMRKLGSLQNRRKVILNMNSAQ